MVERANRQAIAAAMRAAGIPAPTIAELLARLDGKETPPAAVTAIAVNQARVGQMLGCSRFHVRKLVQLGLLPQHDIAGLKRYLVSDVVKLASGGVHHE
jgi:hypothetical protein